MHAFSNNVKSKNKNITFLKSDKYLNDNKFKSKCITRRKQTTNLKR